MLKHLFDALCSSVKKRCNVSKNEKGDYEPSCS